MHLALHVFDVFSLCHSHRRSHEFVLGDSPARRAEIRSRRPREDKVSLGGGSEPLPISCGVWGAL